MNPALEKYLEAASGLTTLTKQKAERIVKQLVRSGEAASDQVSEMVEDLIERQRDNREALTALVRSESTRAVHAMGLATNTEVERLQAQIADLRRELQQLELEVGAVPAGRAAGAARKRTGAKKTAKKTGAKKTAKKAAKKTGAKKTAKKAAKKTGAKRSAKKTAKKTAGGSR